MILQTFWKLSFLVSLLSAGCSTTSSAKKDLQKSTEELLDQGTSDTVIVSLSQSKLLPTINTSEYRQKGNSLAQKAKSSSNKEDLAKAIAYLRTGNGDFGQVLNLGQKLADLQLSEGIQNDLAEDVKLELALAAIKQNKMAFALLFLNELTASQNARIKAASYNALGVLEVVAGRIPEAALNWQLALKSDAQFAPALLNLGMISIKYGDFRNGASYLESVRSQWIADVALITSGRYLGSYAAVDELCDKLMKDQSEQKVVWFNCGLYQWQIKNNRAKAREFMNKALRMPGGPPQWTEEGFRILDQIR